MNKRQKEVLQHELDAEKEVLDKLTKQYQRALNDIDRKLRILESDELTQSRIYRIEHQKVLRKQVAAVLEKLHADEYTTIQQFLTDSYTDAFVGTAYDMFGQGVQLILPIDKNAAVKAVTTDSKISEGLYEALGVDTKKLKNSISSEITRGLASGLPHSEIARNIANTAKAPLARAKTIVRTESHRIQQASKYDAQKAAIKKGANVVKQWNSTLDGDTRPTHKKLDGKFAEVDEFFEMDGKKARYPGDFGDPAEDCNCRCQLLQRARIALDEDELNTLKQRAEFFGLDKTDDLEDFKKKYLHAAQEESKYLYDATVINPAIKTAQYRNLYNNLDESTEIQRTAFQQAKAMLNHRNGTKYEDLTFIDTLTGKYLTRDDYDVENEVIPSRRMRSMVTNNDPYTVIAVHNHPGSSVPSIADSESAYRHKYKYGVVACHNGTVMKYEVLGEYNEVIVGILLDKANKNLYNGSEEELAKTLEMLKAENILLGVFK